MIVNSIAYRHGERIGEVPMEEVSEVIKQPGTFIWLGLHEADAAMLKKIQEEFSLHELAMEDASKAHQRPKIETYADSLFIVLKTARLIDNQVAYGETHIFVGHNYLISIRHGEYPGYTRVRQRCEDTPRQMAKGPGFALYALIDFIVDNYQPIIDKFEEDLDQLEDQVFRNAFDRLAIERLYDLKRELLTLRNAALPVLEICTELMRFHEGVIPKDLRVYFRDVQDHVQRVINSADHMREMLLTAMQVNLSLVTVSQNEVVKKFSGWAAILVLPSVIFSLYGMNFRFMPELEWEYGYPAILAATAGACLLLYRKLKKVNWI